MDSFRKQATLTRAFGASLRGGGTRSISIFLLACLALAAASCGGSSSNAAQTNSGLGGNWQFSLAVPADNSFEGSPYGGTQLSVLQGGFLVQQGGSLSGQALFSIWIPPTNGGNPIECNSGAATITGTLSGANREPDSDFGHSKRGWHHADHANIHSHQRSAKFRWFGYPGRNVFFNSGLLYSSGFKLGGLLWGS